MEPLGRISLNCCPSVLLGGKSSVATSSKDSDNEMPPREPGGLGCCSVLLLYPCEYVDAANDNSELPACGRAPGPSFLGIGSFPGMMIAPTEPSISTREGKTGDWRELIRLFSGCYLGRFGVFPSVNFMGFYFPSR